MEKNSSDLKEEGHKDQMEEDAHKAADPDRITKVKETWKGPVVEGDHKAEGQSAQKVEGHKAEDQSAQKVEGPREEDQSAQKVEDHKAEGPKEDAHKEEDPKVHDQGHHQEVNVHNPHQRKRDQHPHQQKRLQSRVTKTNKKNWNWSLPSQRLRATKLVPPKLC